MDIGDIIGDAVRYPSADWKKVIIYGILMVTMVILITIPLVLGYAFRILKATIAGSNELPDFDQWGEMFIDGLKVFVVGIIYAIPVIILSAIFGLVMRQSITQYVPGNMSALTVFGFIGANFILFIISLIIGLVAYMAISYMAYYDGELGAAFRFSKILDWIAAIGWVDYIIWYIVMFIIGLVAGVISVILIFPLLIGIIIVPLVIAPYWVMFASRSLSILFSSVELEASKERPASLKEPEAEIVPKDDNEAESENEPDKSKKT
jgi:Protein of unknown function (DUF4013)